MSSQLHESQEYLEGFQKALAFLDSCSELTLERYLQVWQIAGVEVDARLRSLWDRRDELARGSGDSNCLRTITQVALLEGIKNCEEAIRNFRPDEGTPAEAIDTEYWDLTDADHHTRTYLEVIWDLFRRGEYQQALARASIMPTAVRNRLGEEDPLYAKVLLSLVEFYDTLGEYVVADRTARSLLAVLEKTGRDQLPEYARALGLLASVSRKVGNPKGAEELLQRARRLWEDVLQIQDPDLARCLQQLAGIHAARNETTVAAELLRQAVDVTEGIFGEESPAYAAALTHRAEHERREKNWSEAERLHQQAFKIRQVVLHANHPHCAESLHALGLICDATGRLANAHEYLLNALSIRRSVLGDWHPEYGTTLEDLASVMSAQGRGPEALPLFHEALGIDDRTIGQAFALGTEQQKLEYMTERMIRLHKYLSLILALGADQDESRAAFSFVLRRKGLVTEAVARQRNAILAARRPEHSERLAEITRLRAFIARRSYAGPQEGESEAEFRRVLEQLSQQRDALEAELGREIPHLDLAQQMMRADWRTLASLLPEGCRLVEFLRIDRYDFTAIPSRGGSRWKPATYLAFVLDPAGSVQLHDLGEAEPIDQLIRAVRDRITGEAEPEDGRDIVKVKPLPVSSEVDRAGGELRTLVFDRWNAGSGAPSRFILAPDGDLSRLPFEILPTADGRRLIDEVSISYVGCGRDLLGFRSSSTGQTAEAVVAADPDFDLAGTEASPPSPELQGRQSRDLGQISDVSFSRLPGTREEGNRIARRLKVKPWLQAEVLEQKIKRLRSPWILHLATHGYFLADQNRDPGRDAWMVRSDLGRFSGLHLENPLLRSGLALAGGNTWLRNERLPPEAEDGLLTAEDVTGMDLLDTELVVLSACDTGLGVIRTGEGVFGLRRAFVLAGVKTLIMSLWKVPDEETQELMDDFYKRLLSGVPRAEALRDAQRAMKARCPNPLLWGAFICQGNPGPLPSKRRWYYCPDGENQRGPVSDTELKDLIRSGQLTPSGKVSLDGTKWSEAQHLKGIHWPSSGTD